MIPLFGCWQDDAAVLQLTDVCYACPGRFLLVLRMRSGSTLRTVYAIEGNLLVGQTDVIGGAALPVADVQALIEQVQALQATADRAKVAVQQAEAALQALQQSSPGRVYIGDAPITPRQADLLIEAGADTWQDKAGMTWAEALSQSWQRMGKRHYLGIELWDQGAWQPLVRF